MALLERVSTLVRANFTTWLTRLNIRKMIKQVILDMENQLLQVKTQVAIAIADQHLLEKKRKKMKTGGRVDAQGRIVGRQETRPPGPSRPAKVESYRDLSKASEQMIDQKTQSKT